jgi:hypothetical protein
MPKIPSIQALPVTGFALLLAAALAAPAPAQEEPVPAGGGSAAETPSPAAEVTFKRIPIPADRSGGEHPYTIEVPLNWGPRPDVPVPGVLLGPPFGDPSNHPEMVLVRDSDVDVSKPEEVLANIEANAKTSDWELLKGEVRDFGGVRGLWIVRKLPPAGMHGERMNLAVKVPLGSRSVDVTATIPQDQFEGALEQQVVRILGSVRPAGGPGA